MRSKGFFYNLAGFVFEYFCDSRRILATFAKFCLNSLFATRSYRFTRHSALDDFSYRLFFSTNLGNFQVRTWVSRKLAVENRVNFQRRDWTGVKWCSLSKKKIFLTLPDLAFGFVYKRCGNEIKWSLSFLLLFVAVVFIVDQTPSRLSVSHREKVALTPHQGACLFPPCSPPMESRVDAGPMLSLL